MDLLPGQTAPEVWLLGVKHLAQRRPREDFDVFLNVASPTKLSKNDVRVLKLVDTFLVGHGGYSVDTVAETIFPLGDYLRGGVKEVFEVYPERMAIIHHARSDRRWGCYALRTLRQKDRNGIVFNPLKDVLQKLKDHRKFKACHELGIGHPFDEEIPIYDGATDRKRTFGNLPCLSHISFKVDGGRLRLNATYRSHYYVQRLLGNLIGLGRLQFFLAREAKLEIGPLTINSTYARLDRGSESGNGNWNYGEISKLLEDCISIYQQPDQ